MAKFRNTEYQRRATRQGLGRLVAEDFYRPAKLPDPRPQGKIIPTRNPEQLKLPFRELEHE